MINWRPTAETKNLKERAKIVRKIRSFFDERDVLEVETPLLSTSSATDPYIQSIPAYYQEINSSKSSKFYLQTSPEFAMKRLLAAGSGSIYQICKAFRNGEKGSCHQPEFTLLEWYRLRFDYHDLMNEMDQFLQSILHTLPAERKSYADIFQEYLKIDPHTASFLELKNCFLERELSSIQGIDLSDRDTLLQLLMTECIEPLLREKEVVFIYDYPVSQAALARIREGAPSVAERFEVYVKGIELANGFHELTDEKEQRKRFESDLKKRAKEGSELIPMDENLLKALECGLPQCSGVALGVDRLVMLALNESSIEKVISFGKE